MPSLDFAEIPLIDIAALRTGHGRDVDDVAAQIVAPAKPPVFSM